jgi:hypothetical protein
MTIHSFPKIFALGEPYIKSIFNDEVEITEKIDGSQFVFGKINGELHMRSKGATLYKDNPEKMFKTAIDYILSIEHLLLNNIIYYSEYLRVPKHNVLSYGRTPTNNLMLFAMFDGTDNKFISDSTCLDDQANYLGIESVPIIHTGTFSADKIHYLLERESILGTQKIEGVVVKNYDQPFLLGGQPIPLMAGKYVSEVFKEKHKANWKGDHAGKGKWELFKDSYITEARWLKSIQHMRDSGLLTESPKDIGLLIKAIQEDIKEEEENNIKEFLWKEFGTELLRNSCHGFPEFYKKYLLENNQ